MRLSLHVAGLVVLAAATGVAGLGQASRPRPLSLSQQMPAPPRVSYSDGKLTVTANNSTVQDVIQAIHGATGTAFQVLGGPTQDRLFGQYGPGTVNTVLEQILRGSGFNYILVSAPNAPGRVKTATLMAKSNEPAASGIAQPRNPNPVNNANVNANNGEEPPPDANVEEDAPQPEPAQEIQQFPQQNGQAQPVDPNQPKTPEQLLQELRQLQLQRQQQQQNNPTNPQ